jgi:enoyl-CoA hydratase
MEGVRVDIADGIATLTIDRPRALNALNSDVLDGIHAAVAGVAGKAGGILVTGGGERAFVAGADIAEMADMSPEEASAFSARGQAAFRALETFPGPVVAAVNGFALGGGLEVALACDVIVAATTAKLGLPEATLGVVPGFGGSQRLPRRVGPGQAKLLMMTGQPVDADTALRIGLVDAVSPPEELIEAARGILMKALRAGPLAVAAVKRLVDEGAHLPIDDALALEARLFGEMFATADQKEGMQAFLEKRKPAYQGR